MKKNSFINVKDTKGDVHLINTAYLMLIVDMEDRSEIIVGSLSNELTTIKSKTPFSSFSKALSEQGFIEFAEDIESNCLLNVEYIRSIVWNKKTDWKSSDGTKLKIDKDMRFRVYLDTTDENYSALFPSMAFDEFADKLKKIVAIETIK